MTPREATSWALYWIGDLVSKTIVNRTLGHWFEWPYRLYSRIMCLALDIQGDGPGPWEDACACGGGDLSGHQTTCPENVDGQSPAETKE